MFAVLVFLATEALGAPLANCVPSPLFADGKACLYGTHCESKFCCPFNKMCMKDSSTSVPDAEMKAQNSDAVYTIMSGSGFVCDAPTTYACVCDEESGEPFEEWDPSQCNCKEDFMEMYEAETWVSCNGDSAANQVPGAADSGTVQPSSVLGLAIALAWL